MYGKTALLWILMIAACATALPAGAGSPTFGRAEQRIVSDDPQDFDGFGFSVSIHGEWALSTAPWDSESGEMGGMVYVFRRSVAGWTLHQKLRPADSTQEDFFGQSVFTDGARAIVGAVEDSDVAMMGGSAYVYALEGDLWTEEAELSAADAAEGDNFGYSVCIRGDTAIVGARYKDDAGIDSGAAYVFVRDSSGWRQQAKLVPADAAAMKSFGMSVAVEGDWAAVGAPSDTQGGFEAGAVYAFRREGETWTEEQKLLAGDPGEFEWFGSALSLDGAALLVGATRDGEAGPDAGAAYVFELVAGAWSQTGKLMASDAFAREAFGGAVGLDGDLALVGAMWDDDLGSVSGSAYIFRRDAGVWMEIEKLLASDGSDGYHFGASVSLHGPCAMAGAQMAEEGGMTAGAAYLYCEECVMFASLYAPDGVCPGEPVLLNASASTATECFGNVLEFRFMDDGGVIRDWSTDPFHTAHPSATTMYVVEARCQADPSCLGYDTTEVAIHPDATPVVVPEGPTAFCSARGESVVLDAGDGYAAYQWLRDSAEIPGSTSRTHEAAESGSYTVRVTDAHGCLWTSASVEADAGHCPCEPQLVCNGLGISPNPVCEGVEQELALDVTGGVGDVSIAWDLDGDTAPDAHGSPVSATLPAGDSIVTALALDSCVPDAQSCHLLETALVEPDPVPSPVSASLRIRRPVGTDDVHATWDDLPPASVRDYELLCLVGPGPPVPSSMEGAPVAAIAPDGAGGATHTGGAASGPGAAFYKVRGTSPCSGTPGPVTNP